MRDYSYPSVYFAYLFFFLSFVVAVFFCVRTRKDGYWGGDAESVKYRMLRDDDEPVDATNPPRPSAVDADRERRRPDGEADSARSASASR